MDKRWTAVSWTLPGDDATVVIGGGPGELPARFETQLAATDDPDLLMQVDLAFDGERVSLLELLVGSTVEPHRPITPSDVARLRIAEAVRTACVTTINAMAEYERWKPAITGVDPKPRRDRRASEAELRRVAAVYAFEYAAWGEPRKAVMQCWGLPRSTANGWIRRAAEVTGGLPGVGVRRG